MLYSLVQSSADAGRPARWLAAQMEWMWKNPLFQFNPFARHMVATCELLSHAAASHSRPDFRINETTMQGEVVAVKQEVVLRTAFCELLHFRKETAVVQPQVLIVAPLSGHFATLLRGTVEAFLPDHDVYITDWLNARDIPVWQGAFGVDDSIDVIMDCIRSLGPDTHVVAVCQPAVTTLAAISLLAANSPHAAPRSMTLIGGPIDTRINPTAVNRFAESHSLNWFESRVISSVPMYLPGAFRRVYPGFLQLAGFLSMNIDKHTKAHREMFDNLVKGDGASATATRTFYDEYTSVMDLPAEFYLDTIKRVFKEHMLARGYFPYRGAAIDPSAVTRTACLVVEGELDDICGVGQTQAAHTLLCGLPDNKKGYHLQEKVGHYGTFNGKRFQSTVYPKIRDFVLAHD